MFSPTRNKLQTNQILCFSKRTNAFVLSKKSDSLCSLTYYLSKVWRYLFHPDTRIKEVFEKTYEQGLEEIKQCSTNEEKTLALTILEENLNSLNNAINLHNKRRFSQFLVSHRWIGVYINFSEITDSIDQLKNNLSKIESSSQEINKNNLQHPSSTVILNSEIPLTLVESAQNPFEELNSEKMNILSSNWDRNPDISDCLQDTALAEPINISESRLKDLQRNISNQKLLKTKIFEFVSANIFAQCKRLDVDKPIVICGEVLGDGKGDYFHMLSFAKHIRKEFSSIPIEFIVISDPIHRGSLKFPQIKKCNSYIYYYNDKPEDFIELLNEKISNSSLWISGPVLPKDVNFSNSEISNKGVAISEYDALSNDGGQCNKRIQMGLSSEAAGIFLNSTNKARGWFNLKNQPLKDYLWKNEPLIDFQINPIQYNATNQLFVCYRSSGFVDFLALALSFTNYTNKEVIDICIFSSKFFQEINDEMSIFSKFQFSQIKFVSFDGDEAKEEVIKIQETGKTLRLIYPGFLDKKDFKLLLSLSSPVVGCTGDGSLGDVISLGKIPFYEINLHKRNLFAQLTSISTKLFIENSDLTEYFKITGNKFRRIDAEHPFDWPKIIEQAQSLSQFVKKERGFKPFLTGAVNEALYRQNSNFAAKEDVIKRSYIEGVITREVMEIQLKQLITGFRKLSMESN